MSSFFYLFFPFHSFIYRRKSTSLAIYSLERMFAKFSMQSDSSMAALFEMGSMKLQDTAVDSVNAFKDLLQPRSDTKEQPLIHVTFKSFEVGDMDVNVVINGPRLYLIPDPFIEIYVSAKDYTFFPSNFESSVFQCH